MVTDNVYGYLWGKLVLGCVYSRAPWSMPTSWTYSTGDYSPVLTDIGGEAVAVADAMRVRLGAGARGFGWANLDEVRSAADPDARSADRA